VTPALCEEIAEHDPLRCGVDGTPSLRRVLGRLFVLSIRLYVMAVPRPPAYDWQLRIRGLACLRDPHQAQ
jgi:hypothetical protein